MGPKDTVAFFSYHEAVPDTEAETDDLWKESCLAWGPQPALRVLLASLTALLCVTVAMSITTAVVSSQKAQMGLLTLTHRAKRPSVTFALLAGAGAGAQLREADLCPVLGRFGGVSSGGVVAVLVTGSLPHSQTEKQFQGSRV